MVQRQCDGMEFDCFDCTKWQCFCGRGAVIVLPWIASSAIVNEVGTGANIDWSSCALIYSNGIIRIIICENICTNHFICGDSFNGKFRLRRVIRSGECVWCDGCDSSGGDRFPVKWHTLTRPPPQEHKHICELDELIAANACAKVSHKSCR